jgi:hypothetical protein
MYGATKAQAFIEVMPESDYTSDDLFLWLQTLFAIERLKVSAPADTRAAIASCETHLAARPSSNSVASLWIDNFLPTWVRLCWRAGLVKCQLNDGALINASDIPCDLRDEHIPLFLPNIERPDLISASILLGKLLQSEKLWEFKTYPGAFWDPSIGRLIIPLPCWSGTEGALDLRALKPLFDDILNAGMGHVASIEILPVGQSQDFSLAQIPLLTIKESVCRQMTHKAFATAESIGVIGLDAL